MQVSGLRWVQNGVVDFASAKLQVVVFWAHWCPLSKLVFPRLNELQQELLSEGVSLLVLATNNEEAVRAIFRQGQWSALAAAVDDGQKSNFRKFMGSFGVSTSPYGFVLQEGQLLHRGALVDSRDEDGLASFLAKVRACAAGEFTAADAADLTARKAEAERFCEGVQKAFADGNDDEFLRLLKDLYASDVDDYLALYHMMLSVAGCYLPKEWKFNMDRLGGVEERGVNIDLALIAAKIAWKQRRGSDWKTNRALGLALAASGEYVEALEKLQRAYELEKAPRILESILAPIHAVQKSLGRPLAPETVDVGDEGKAPEVLTADELVADLKESHEIIKGQYGAYDCLAWELAAYDQSWSSRLDEYVKLARAKEQWPWDEAFELLRQFLALIQDAHFSISCGDKRVRFMRPIGPFYSKLRVRQVGDVFKVTSGADELVGREVTDAKLVPGPYDAKVLVPYLFPTTKNEYLLGLLAEIDEPLVNFEFSLGLLPLHRSRTFIDRDPDEDEVWGIELPPHTPIATVRNSRCDMRKLDGFFETANKVRELDKVILDLRGNRGGTDNVPIEWMYRFHKQNYQWVGGASVNYNEPDTIKRWSSGFGRMLDEGPLAYRGEGVATKAFEGKFYVAIDKLVASSGETFTQMAAQVPGATLVGENTLGCVGYGGCFKRPPLKFSRIQLYFGSIKFCPDESRPIREGYGFFPDLWIDEFDVATVLAKEA